MNDVAHSSPTAGIVTPQPLAEDCAGQDFYALDRGLRDLIGLYLEPAIRTHLEPHFQRLGRLAGGRLDEIARIADRHPPVLHARDRFGRDEDWIEYHPAYREMEQIAFGDFQFHAMSHRAGVLGLDRPLPAVAKYAFQYLFVQAEFGHHVPDQRLGHVDPSDPSLCGAGAQGLSAAAHALGRHGRALEGHAVHDREGGGLRRRRRSRRWRATTAARWRLTGEKWFCSHTDADVALMLARPEGAPAGTSGLALFACPRTSRGRPRNSYRIVRLKDKLGTRSMASGEIRFEGAEAYLVGDQTRGLKQMMDQVNLSRLSHGVRAAAMMRRCLNEALAAARTRRAFGRAIIEHPLLRRQLMKILVPAEQALSMAMLTAATMDRETAGDNAREGADAHPDAADQAPGLPRQHPRRDRRHGGARRQRLHRGMGQRAARARRPYRRALGGHQQHQRHRRRAPRGRQVRLR